MFLHPLVQYCLTIVNEISPTSLKSLFNSFHQMAVSLGIFMTYIISIHFVLKDDLDESEDYVKVLNRKLLWRFSICFPTILGFIQILLMLIVFKYDSPQYYISLLKPKENDLVVLFINLGDEGSNTNIW